MPVNGLLAVGAGATLGAWLRGLVKPHLADPAPRPLSANLLGGFIIGGVMSAADPLGFPPAVRLLVVTGFLGGLSTFSTFSAESTTLVLQARYSWALLAIFTHVAGSLCMTMLGVFLIRAHLGE